VKKHLVLIVDDIAENIQVLGNILKKADYKVAVAMNGSDAISEIVEIRPDIVLLDVMMPGIDGYEVCRRVRKDSLVADIPIIFLTAKVGEDSVVEGLAAGGQDYVTKPFNPKELLSRVETHIELKEKRDELNNINETLEEKVRERTEELNRANSRLKNLDTAKSNLLELISNKLAKPVSDIKKIVSGAEGKCNNDELMNSFTLLKNNTEKLDQFFNAATLITSFKANDMKIYIKPVEAALLIDAALLKVKNKIIEKNIKIEQYIEDNVKIPIDYDMVVKSIAIVLENAVKYSPGGSAINISVTNGNESVEILIRDSGPGFKDEHGDAFFEYFSSKESGLSGGIGLGLATVKLIMDAHYGKITLSNNDYGALVIFSFPKDIFSKKLEHLLQD